MASRVQKKTPRPVRIALAFLIMGLMLSTLPLTLGRSLHWSDGARGLCTGIGLGLELVAMVLLLRQTRPGRTASRS